MKSFISVSVAFLAAIRVSLGTPTPGPALVDLGYAIHSATLNATGNVYSFSNIRYADPPERFSKPIAPTFIDRVVNNGTIGGMCPQAYPWWLVEFLAQQNGLPPSLLESFLYLSPVTEDCLFLDVYVPKNIFDKKHLKKASVLVWIYGGGFTSGTKDDPVYNPAGLIAESQINDQQGIIFIKLNYRLGAFGWLSGSEADPNIGLWDQRLALDWVQKYVKLFGGDPNRVTVMGESAGGGSIMHHITAFGGRKGHAPFQRAIPQSPGFSIDPDNELGFKRALEFASLKTGTPITTLDGLRALDSSTMIAVSKSVVNASSPGSWTYTPVIDGTYVPDLPGVLLCKGKFDHRVKVMAGHTADEGKLFTPTNISSTEDIVAGLRRSMFGISDEALDYITTVLYPADFTGAYPYTSHYERAKLLHAESGLACNTRYLAKAYDGEVFNYRFNYPPATHGQDVPFEFFNGDVENTMTPGVPISPQIAVPMQQYFTRFTQKGNPNGLPSLPQWPVYSDDATLLDFGASAISTVTDPNANSRCDYWQSAGWKN